MGAPVPVDDLPQVRAVPADDLPQPPSHFQRYLKDVAEGTKFGPLGIAYGASKIGNELIEHSAYNAGGAVADTAAKFTSPETAAKLGVAANVGVQAIPVLAGGALGKAVAPAVGLGEVAKDTMQSALKPTYEALRTGKAAKAIDTMFEEGINVSKGGVAQLRARINSLNDQIVEAIKNSPATVDKDRVASGLAGELARLKGAVNGAYEGMQVNPQEKIKALEDAWTKFINQPALLGKDAMPVQMAQKMKQGTYKDLGEKAYGEMKGADIEAQKTLARGLKDEIAQAVPGVAGLNAEESKLLGALSVVERRVLMEANKNPMGLALLAKNPEAWAGFMADRSALFKSLAARMLNANKDTIPVAAGSALGAVGGFQAGRPQQ